MASEVITPFVSRLQLNVKDGDVSSDKNTTCSVDYEELVPTDNLRVNGITVFRPIIYGNVSYRLERPPSKNQTLSCRILEEDNNDWFRWTVYVRGVENEDLSYFIKKVVFYLHDSYTEPIRVIEQAPFEMTEEGWGQFDIKIEIFFHDIPGLQTKQSLKSTSQKRKNTNSNSNSSYNYDIKSMLKDKELEISEIIPSCYDRLNENKISLIHGLRLFAKDSTEDSKKGIIEESFSEIEFIDPYYSLYEKLILGPHKLIQNHPFCHHWKNKMINIAEKEQLLIDKISSTHRDLLKKIKAAKQEYQILSQNVSNQ